MNDMSPWEKQLESWTPRPPSARLKQQLFGPKREATATRPTRTPPVWAWLAPATCLLVTALSMNMWVTRPDRPPYMSGMGGSNMIASLALPRALVLDYSPDTRAQENIWAVATSDRSLSHSISPTGSASPWKTNLHF